jgi:hypothetical protein
MKFIILSLFLLLSCPLVQAQNATLNQFYKQHRTGEEAISMLLPGWLVQASVNIGARDRAARQALKPLRPFLRRLSSVRLLTVEKALPQGAVQTLLQQIQQQDFSPILRIREGGSSIHLLVRLKERGSQHRRRSMVKNLLLVVEEANEVLVFTINGRWDMQQVQQLLQPPQTQALLASI